MVLQAPLVAWRARISNLDWPIFLRLLSRLILPVLLLALDDFPSGVLSEELEPPSEQRDGRAYNSVGMTALHYS